MTEQTLEIDARRAREHYRWWLEMPLRWVDNDRYGHLNNARYYSLFENLLMTWLEVEQGFDLATGPVRCYTVENGCRYHEAVAWPDTLRAGLRVARIGRSSVRYEIGLFSDASAGAVATGFSAEVFVDAESGRPTPVPDTIRTALGTLVDD